MMKHSATMNARQKMWLTTKEMRGIIPIPVPALVERGGRR